MTAAGSLAGAGHPRRLGAGAEPGPGNAISLAETPVFDRLWDEFPHTQLSAQGRDVGLPEGQMGNSEVGHLNLGAGAIVKQDLARIDDAIADGSFFENEALLAACDRARDSPRGRLHLLGLVSDGGVHSGWEHIEATIELASQEGVPDVVFHAFTDGRDTLPHGGRGYLGELERWLRQAGRVATVSGRYYAMDRDTRWERTKLAYDAIVHAEGLRAASSAEAIEASYERERDRRVRQADRDRRLRRRRRGRRRRSSSTSVPTGRGEMTRALAEPGLRRVLPRRRPAARADDDDRVPQGLALSGRLPRGAAEDDPGGDDLRGRRAPAARRRDREVRPRHLLLQRRPRAGVGGGGAPPGRLAARRPHLRPQAGDERPRRRRHLRRRTGRRATTASASSTSPTPTWSATPA